jgi:CubicO group peptidase (beta-lactamase class C family)
MRGLCSRGALIMAGMAPLVAWPDPAPAASPSAVYYPGPGEAWERRAPGGVGLDEGRLREAVAFAVASETKAPRDLALEHALSYAKEPYDDPAGPFKERGPATGVVIRRGYVVAEWGDPSRVDMTFSVTKSFLSAVVGVAYDRGLIKDLRRRVGDQVPLEQFRSAHNAKITWDDLLRQTSDWEGTLWGKPDWADRPSGDLAQWIARPRNDPGTVYKYNDVRVNALALAALHVWRRPLPDVLREAVMEPIGASSTWHWHGYDNSWVEIDGKRVQSVSGGGHWGGGMWISAWDQARFGYLTLRRGQWKGRPLLSDAWVTMSLRPTTAEPGYGFMNWFLNTGRKLLPSAPESSFAHLGAGTNMIYVDAENDLVVVARWIDRGAMDGLVQRTLAAVR